MAALFAHQAKTTLSDKKLSDLQRFLSNHISTQDPDYLQRRLLDRLQAFYTAELQEFRVSSDRLARLSGPVNADIGVIMHCQSKERAIGDSWDIVSVSTQTLSQKGLSQNFVFSYDWRQLFSYELEQLAALLT